MAEPVSQTAAAIVNIAIATSVVVATWRLTNYTIDAGLLAGKKAIKFGEEALTSSPKPTKTTP